MWDELLSMVRRMKIIGRSLTGIIGLAVLLAISVGTVANSSEVAKHMEAVEARAWDLWEAKEEEGIAPLFGEPDVWVAADGVNAGVANTVGLDIRITPASVIKSCKR